MSGKKNMNSALTKLIIYMNNRVIMTSTLQSYKSSANDETIFNALRKEGFAVPTLIFSKLVAECDAILFLVATLNIKQCRILSGKFVITFIRTL